MAKHRLHKLMASAGICSRRKAEELIKQQRVKINGILAKPGDKADLNIDKILVDGFELISNNHSARLILLHKPH